MIYMNIQKKILTDYIEYLEEYLLCPEKYRGCYEWYFSSGYIEFLLRELKYDLESINKRFTLINDSKQECRNRRRNNRKAKRKIIIKYKLKNYPAYYSQDFRFAKKISNKKVRKHDDLINGSYYKKAFNMTFYLDRT
ncbi:hypothetical protein [Alkaliphilus sp. B6464]|uniref:hypothetical protein n=1 Tax=Alkaliphilus sp. B6464 TaxID=2731219 RepID=UPI001BAA61E1|nr:hypothetical protein [Alkaliphilus sp. B6464]QUH21821.1 hypothetical protein HYG84_17955 [Alkaliphilus sp. B6464]